MEKCKKCGSNQIVIISELTFGHGDSTTETYGQCKDCNMVSKKVTEWGFPAKYEDIRLAQKYCNEENK